MDDKNKIQIKNPNIFWSPVKLTVPLAFIGAATILSKTFKFFYRIYPLFLPKKNLIKKYGKNSWVAITGASDGLGKQFAYEFSRYGFNCILFARNQKKIQKVEQELKTIFPNVSYKIILADFQNVLQENFFKNIEESINDIDVKILVNNVGITSVNSFFNENDESIKEQILINSYSTIILSKIFLKSKFSTKQNNNEKCAIINIGSILGKFSLPYLSIYCGTKAFVNNFSESLYFELKERNIDIFCLTPYYVSTKMTGYKKISFDTITPEECVRSAIKQFSYGKRESSGNYKHEIVTALLENLWLRSYFIKIKKTYYKNLVERAEKILNLRRRKTNDRNNQ